MCLQPVSFGYYYKIILQKKNGKGIGKGSFEINLVTLQNCSCFNDAFSCCLLWIQYPQESNILAPSPGICNCFTKFPTAFLKGKKPFPQVVTYNKPTKLSLCSSCNSENASFDLVILSGEILIVESTNARVSTGVDTMLLVFGTK